MFSLLTQVADYSLSQNTEKEWRIYKNITQINFVKKTPKCLGSGFSE